MITRRSWLAGATAAGLAMGANEPAPYKRGKGWKNLSGAGLEGWVDEHSKPHEWMAANAVAASGKTLNASGSGQILVNGPKGRTGNLVTGTKFGDVELYVEFMVPQGSNSGVYLQGLYEIQVFDSHGVAKPSTTDCGAIYHRWINEKPVGGSAPRVNASRAPGEWQWFHAWFEAPRFDASGKKTKDARFVRVLHNGQVVQENVVVDGGTRAHMNIPEAAQNPIMLQGDHGPVAYRNLWIRPSGK
ncbi:MAG TPA: DUF1080 domain-containing protein [Bryobacteraceae bacterium]|nr:DUF1080 domain-containing protein [Bryobacteraceae bacterium]